MKNCKSIVLGGVILGGLLAGAATVEVACADPAVDFAARELRAALASVDGAVTLAAEPSLPAQAWRLRTTDGRLVISGRDGMGVVYGVYAFLEKYGGARWYAPDTSRPARFARLPALDETGRPAILSREMYVGEDYMDSTWRLRNKETVRADFGVGTHSGRPGDCHTYDHYVKCVTNKTLFGRTEKGGACSTLCMSNPEVARLVAARMCAYVAEDRAARKGKSAYLVPDLYELSQSDGDGGSECHCPACHRLHVQAGNRYSGPNVRFANAVAREVAKTYPDVMVRTFAYSYTEMPPLDDTRADDNVSIRYCRSFTFAPLVKGSYNGDVLEAWGRHAKHKHVWGYWRTYSGPLFPLVKPRADIGAEMRFCRDQGVVGYFAEAEAPLSRSFAQLQHWLFLKLAEDPDRDAFALADEFLAAYYGAGAAPMKTFLDYLERRLVAMRAKIDRKFLEETNSGNLAMFTTCDWMDREFFEKANAWLDDAEARTAGDARALAHVRRERSVVDRAMYHNVEALAATGYSFDRAKTAARFAANARMVVETWPALPRDARAKRLEKVAAEAALFARLPLPLPKELEGREAVVLHWPDLGNGSGEKVPDPDAAAGFAFQMKNVDLAKRPVTFGVYCPSAKLHGEVMLKPEQVPQDEKYHLYRVGAGRTPVSARFFHDWTWRSATWLPCYGAPAEEREFWLSVKITGPAFVKGSTRPNGVLTDRAFVVRPVTCRSR